jgi:hypothetical protein
MKYRHVTLWPKIYIWKNSIRLIFSETQGHMPSYSVKCGIYGVISFSSLDLCLQWMNIEASELGKIEQNAFEKYVNYVRFEVLTTMIKMNYTFWNITPCSPLRVNWCFRGVCSLHPHGRRISKARNQRESKQLSLSPAFTVVSRLAYSLTLKMDATCSSETSVDFQRTTRRYIPKHRTLHVYYKYGKSVHSLPTNHLYSQSK